MATTDRLTSSFTGPLMSLPTRSPGLATAGLCLALAVLGAACGDSNGPSNRVALSGTVTDYFAATPIANAFLSVNELSVTGSAKANGTFRLTGIPTSSTLTVTVSAANYAATVSDTIQFDTHSLTRSLQAVASADVNRQFVAVGVGAVPGTAMVIATLPDAGTPLVGVPLVDIALRDSAQNTVGSGPYVVGATGDLDPTLTQTSSFGGRSRIAYLNVPAGQATLTVTIAGGTPLVANVLTSASGVTLVTP